MDQDEVTSSTTAESEQAPATEGTRQPHWRELLPKYDRVEYEYIIYPKPVTRTRPQIPAGNKGHTVTIWGETIARIYLKPGDDVADAMGYAYVSTTDKVFDLIRGQNISRGRAERALVCQELIAMGEQIYDESSVEILADIII